MTIRRSRSQWDPRYDRLEHVAGDGIVDFVSYEPLPGTTSVPPFQATQRPASTWFKLAVAFMSSIIANQVSAWLQ